MKIYRLTGSIVIENENGKQFSKMITDWDEYINRDDLYSFLQLEISSATPVGKLNRDELLHPVGRQEVWAAGVTYLRSRDARKEESKESGGSTFYDLVYNAERPEIFFKATAQRVVGDGGKVRIRKDSTWNVPEPELTLFITSNRKIVGYTIGNDMSSRSIEGENPLYLPQAKVYEACAGIGPCLYVPEVPISKDTIIAIKITRDGDIQFNDSVAISQMKREHTELVEYLYRECAFPHGCFLMTGTCMVPPNDFTLRSGDIIHISIDNIGSLTNIVA